MSRAALRQHVLALAFYSGLAALALYWPLLNAATHVGDTLPTDYYHFHWNYWWIRHALTTPSLHVYETNFVLFPYTTNLAFHTLTPFWYPAWALLEPLTGTMVAMNLIHAAAFALTGYAFYALLRRERVPASLALAGGALLLLTPAMLLSAFINNINYLSLFWYPALILVWGQVARTADTPRQGVLWALVMGAAVYAMLMTDYQHALFAAFLLIPYGLLTLWQADGWRARLRLALLGLLALVTALALLWFAGPLPYILAFDRTALSPQAIESAKGIRFPQGYLWRTSPYSRDITLGVFVLPLTLAALVVSLVRRRRPALLPRHWFWLALIPVPLLLSLGPSVTLLGTDIPTPYVLLHQAFGGMFRVPARFAPVILIPALIFSGQALGALLPRRLGLRTVAGAVVVLIALAESRLFEPMPLRPKARDYAFYAAMGAEQGPPYEGYAVVEVPVAGGSGEAWVGEFRPMETQLYGMTHGKRMLNGSIARAPLAHFWHWLYDDAMLAWLGQRRWLEPELVEAQLRERIYGWPIGYIVVHQDLIGREGPTAQEIIGYFNSLPDLLCPVWVEGDAVAYRSAWHPDGCPPRTPPEVEPGAYLIDIGAAGDERYIGWGWHWPEDVGSVTWRWTGEHPQTRLYVDLPPGAYTLTLTMQAFHEARQVVGRANGTEIGSADVPTGSLGAFTLDVPAEAIGDGRQVEIVLDYDGVASPAEVGQGSDTRRLAVAVESVRFERLP